VQLLSRLSRKIKHAEGGFTLIELLVVAPVAILVIAGMIALMVALVGDVAVSRERSVSSYDVQDALDRIEQDARISTTYMPTFSLFSSPQGRNGGTQAFDSTANGDIIMSQYATTASPYDASRKIVYYADQPNPCSGSYTLNRPLTVRVIYFTTNDAFGTKTLWRRTIVPPASTTATDTTKVCDAPWQRDSCPAPVTLSATCQGTDEKMLDYVSAFTTTYYNDAGATVTAANARTAASLKVTLTQNKKVAGETIATSGTTRGSHINVTTDDIPATPDVYVYNPSINTYNNPILTTFAWDTVQNAAVYSVRYQINGGAWVNAPDQTSTQFQVTVARPRDTINIRVAAKNDMGVSTEDLFSYTTPLWTVANLEGDWVCYQPTESTWPCPSYTLSDAGMVMIRGLAKNSATSARTTVFTMPSGLRPHQQQIFPVSADNDFGRTDAMLDGQIVYAGTSGNYVALDMVHYIAEGTPGITWTNVPIGTWNNWTNYGSVYGTPDYARDSMGRISVVGLITGSGATPANTCTGCDMLNYGSGSNLGTPLAAIYPGVASPNVFYNLQVTNEPRVESRGDGAPTAWNSIGATYYPSDTNLPHIALPLANSWIRYSTTFHNAEYRKAADGLVSVRGLIKGGTVSNNIVLATLPNGYCPSKRQIFTTVGVIAPASEANQAVARVDVTAGNGTTGCTINLYPYGGLSNSWLSLEGIMFYQEN
jgi:hypothetical protein